MMKIHSINLNKYKDIFYSSLFYKNNLVYFYILLFNTALLIIVSVPTIITLFLFVLEGGISFFWGVVEWIFGIDFVSFLKSFKDVVFLNSIGVFIGLWVQSMIEYGMWLLGLFVDSPILPMYTVVTLIITYFLKDQIINTSYYQLFKKRFIDLLENNFTKYFLLFFSIFVFYLLLCLCIIYIAKFDKFAFIMKIYVSYSFLFAFRTQIFSWFLPFLWAYFFLSFWIFIYRLFIVDCSLGVKYVYILYGIFTFFSIYMFSPSIFLGWEGNIYYNGFYNWYVIYKLSRYFIIYPIVTSFLIGLTLSLFLYFIKRK